MTTAEKLLPENPYPYIFRTVCKNVCTKNLNMGSTTDHSLPTNSCPKMS